VRILRCLNPCASRRHPRIPRSDDAPGKVVMFARTRLLLLNMRGEKHAFTRCFSASNTLASHAFA